LTLRLLCLSTCTASSSSQYLSFFFFFIAPATTEIYTLSLHDALPIFPPPPVRGVGTAGGFALMLEDRGGFGPQVLQKQTENLLRDRKSTRLNSSHLVISYAVFCLKKKIKYKKPQR